MNRTDTQLKEALEEWREAATIQKYGPAYFQDFGPSLIMPNEVLDRIILCAHAKKIATEADIIKETVWSKAATFATEVVAIIHRHNPPPAAPALVLEPLQTHIVGSTRDSANLSLAKRSRHCGACGGVDHIGECFVYYYGGRLIIPYISSIKRKMSETLRSKLVQGEHRSVELS